LPLYFPKLVRFQCDTAYFETSARASEVFRW
jgi:hypothetical protein